MRRLPLLAAAWLGLAAAYGVTPLRVEQGATWSRQFEARRDLTGCTLGMEIRASAGGTLYAAPTLTVTDAARGQFTASLTAVQTEALGWSGLAVWDVEATCSSTVLRLFEGTAELTPQVTVGEVAPGSWPTPATPPGELYLRTADAASTYVPQMGTALASTLTLWERDTSDATSGAFKCVIDGATNSGGTRNYTWRCGHNIDKAQAGTSAAWWSTESHYEVSPGVFWTETHLNQCSAPDLGAPGNDGDCARPFAANLIEATGDIAVEIRGAGPGGSISLKTDNTQQLRLIPGGIQVTTATPISWTAAGAKTFLSGMNVAGTNVRTLLQLYADDNIGLGGTGVIRYDPANAKLAFHAFNPISKPTVSGARGDSEGALASALTALANYGLITNSTTAGTTTATQAVSATPSLGTCDASARGQFQYLDDTNDGAVSRICFCGTAADDTTYAWRRADAPATTCP